MSKKKPEHNFHSEIKLGARLIMPSQNSQTPCTLMSCHVVKTYQELDICRMQLVLSDHMNKQSFLNAFIYIENINKQAPYIVFKGIVVSATKRFEHEKLVLDVEAYTAPSVESYVIKKDFILQKEEQTLKTLLDDYAQLFNFSWEVGGDKAIEEKLAMPYPFFSCFGQSPLHCLSLILSGNAINWRWDADISRLIVGEGGARGARHCKDTTSKKAQELLDADTTFSIVHIQESISSPPTDLYIQNWGADEYQQGNTLVQKPSVETRVCFNTRKTCFNVGMLLFHTSWNTLVRVTKVECTQLSPSEEPIFTVFAMCNDSEREPVYTPTLPAIPVLPSCLATVVTTKNDPLKKGRIQVLPQITQDSAKSTAASTDIATAWIPVLTSFEGQHAGLCISPEKGDSVLLECLDFFRGIWGIKSCLRRKALSMSCEDPTEYKGIFASSKSYIAFSKKNADNASDFPEEVHLQCGDVFLEFKNTKDAGVRIFLENSRKTVLSLSMDASGKSKATLDVDDIEIQAKETMTLYSQGSMQLFAATDMAMVAKNLTVSAQTQLTLQAKNNMHLESSSIHFKNSVSSFPDIVKPVSTSSPRQESPVQGGQDVSPRPIATRGKSSHGSKETLKASAESDISEPVVLSSTEAEKEAFIPSQEENVQIPLNFSKSQYIQGLQCPKALWFIKYRKNLSSHIHKDMQASFGIGREVGELAKTAFQDGVEVKIPFNEIEHAVAMTQKFVQQECKVIFEATAINPHDGTFCRVDILEKNPNNTWNLIEVKSSTQMKDYHLDDISFQYHVFSGAGYTIEKCFIMYINSNSTKQGALHHKALFRRHDITNQVFINQNIVVRNISEFENIINLVKEPQKEIGLHCLNPFTCSFYQYCWEAVPEYSIFDIYTKNKAFDICKQIDSYDVHDIPQHLFPAGKKCIDIECYQKNKIHREQKEIDLWIKENLQYPLYFLDYESIFPAIPLFNGTRPFQQIPFQFSLHIQGSAEGKLVHSEFIHKEISDPRESFIQALVTKCGTHGSIVVYNKTFEATRNKELAQDFPPYAQQLQHINERMVDLLIPFRSRWLYHPQQKSSASIKAVLPAFTSLSYTGMGIRNGNDAMNAYHSFAKGMLSTNEVTSLWENLSKYCELDTLAMVELLHVLKNPDTNS